MSNITIEIEPGVAVDLYAAASIQVGTQIEVENLCEFSGKLYSTQSSPSSTDDFSRLWPEDSLVNESGDLGAWIASDNKMLLRVRVV